MTRCLGCSRAVENQDDLILRSFPREPKASSSAFPSSYLAHFFEGLILLDPKRGSEWRLGKRTRKK